MQVILGQANSAITNLKGRGKGKSLVVCGNGPSLAEAPLDRLKGLSNVEFLAINVPDPRVWPTQYWILLDSVNMLRPECAGFIPDYQGIVITNHVKKNVQFRHMVRILLHRGSGIGRDMLCGVRMGNSSGYVALQAALYMGFQDIYFFGLDMWKSEDGELWNFGENSGIRPETRLKMFEADAEYWNIGADQLTPDERAHIFVCSTLNPWPFVKKFTQLSPIKGVEKIIGPETTAADSAPAAEPASPSL